MACCHVGLVMGATVNVFPPSLEFAKLTKLLEAAGYTLLYITRVDNDESGQLHTEILIQFSFQDVFVVASRPYAQRAVLKFAR